MMMFLSKTCTMAMKAEVLMQEKFKSEAHSRSYNKNNYQRPSEKLKSTMDIVAVQADKFKEQKATGKQKEKEMLEK